MDALHFLLNVLFALLAGWLTMWIATEVHAPRPVAVLCAVIVGVLVFFANLAARVV